MVGSNSFSGLGRFALCETLESRNFFSIAAAYDTAFGGGPVKVQFGGGSEFGYTATVLPSGKLAVSGMSFDQPDGSSRVAIAVLNTNGTLDSSFDGDGKLLLPATVSNRIDQPKKLVVLPNGSLLLIGFSGIYKMTAAGVADTSFGPNGDGTVKTDRYPADQRVEANGTIRLLASDGELTTVSADGKAISRVASPVNTVASFASNGDILVARNYGVTRYDAQYKPIASYGYSGLASFYTPLQRLISNSGQFTTRAGKALSASEALKAISLQQPVAAADGSVVVRAVLSASTPAIASSQQPYYVDDNYDVPVFEKATTFWIKIDPTGKKFTIQSGDNTGGPEIFSNYITDVGPNVHATIYDASGPARDINLPNWSTNFVEGVEAANGATYVVGSIAAHPGDLDYSFYVARILPAGSPPPATGTITGILFNDNNANAVKDGNDTVNAGKVIYLDTNANGRLDNGEKSTTTDANGRYTFSGLAAGTYNVRRVTPVGYRVTTDEATFGGHTTIAAGQTRTLDIGSTSAGVVYGRVYYADAQGSPNGPAVAGQRVWFDVNKNGKYEVGEPTSVSDANGFYQIAAPGGNYWITSIPPVGYRIEGFYQGNYFDASVPAADRSQEPIPFIPIKK